MSDSAQANPSTKKRAKVSQSEFPNNNLQSALRIAQALWDHFAGKSAAPHEIAMALDMSPTSGGWRNLCGSSIAYGLTEGGYAADQITLTGLGRRIVAPTIEGEDVAAMADAVLSPRIMQAFFSKYDKAKFPRDDIAKNVLVNFGLPKERADKAFEILEENGRNVGILHDTKTGLFVAVGTPAPIRVEAISDEPDAAVEADVEGEDDVGVVELPDLDETPTRMTGARGPVHDGPKQIFVAHGKNLKPLNDLKKILDRFKIPYKVAVDEPHAGRPISKKVADLMKSCSAGIFIFTKDEKFVREDGEEVWRPSENVVYELGAASILWENKIIILRESGVNFPSDFSDLGYIKFDDGEIASKGIEIFGELLELEFVKVQAA
jgi:CAP12/Pycsar effector protein, TIR domain